MVWVDADAPSRFVALVLWVEGAEGAEEATVRQLGTRRNEVYPVSRLRAR